jgi:DNA-binding winged helix-turn-helix (wHTH) protein
MRYDFGEMSLDTDARQLRRGESFVHLSPKAMELLIILIAERPRAVPRRELQDRVWPDTFVVAANLPMLIREIRGALDDKERRIIRTVHRTGYAFGIDVREAPSLRRERNDFVHLLVYDNRQYRLADGENLVGREPGAEIFLPSASVSRRHAVITVDGRRAILTDLASKNGTFIGDDALHDDASLEDGNVIRFGEVIVRYRCCSADKATDSLASL